MAEEGRRADQVGDVIAEIETDKATMEVEATDEGTLARS
jgi:Pyruvate/2-oxoglutarate dehydrogenase complex, dihydrolipoamide acyltransferase (E2) component, and related enzymes